MTNKLISIIMRKCRLSVLNVKSIKVTNGENVDKLPFQVSTKGI